MKCDFCQKDEGVFILKSGKHCCKKFPSQCPAVREKNSASQNRLGESKSELMKRQYAEGKRKCYFKNDGSTWKGRKHKEETKEKLKNMFFGRKMDDSFRKKRSEEMKERYSNGWESKAGRTKKIVYESPSNGFVTVDGSWELEVCKFFDKQSINWKRNKERFKYVDREGKVRSYCPDFYLPDSDIYIEVKGHETDLDRLKWSQFPKKIEIWKKKELIDRKIIGG